jgi:BolA protein
MNRMAVIKERLQEAFAPSHLEVIDDSEQHRGHVGSQNGAGHYTVVIVADGLKDLSRVEAHRKVYAELNDLIPDEIHALRILLSL